MSNVTFYLTWPNSYVRTYIVHIIIIIWTFLICIMWIILCCGEWMPAFKLEAGEKWSFQLLQIFLPSKTGEFLLLFLFLGIICGKNQFDANHQIIISRVQRWTIKVEIGCKGNCVKSVQKSIRLLHPSTRRFIKSLLETFASMTRRLAWREEWCVFSADHQ